MGNLFTKHRSQSFQAQTSKETKEEEEAEAAAEIGTEDDSPSKESTGTTSSSTINQHNNETTIDPTLTSTSSCVTTSFRPTFNHIHHNRRSHGRKKHLKFTSLSMSLAPIIRLFHGNHNKASNKHKNIHYPRVCTLLEGCDDVQCHWEYVDKVKEIANMYKGKDGLDALGFEYRNIHHDNHNNIIDNDNEEEDKCLTTEDEKKEEYLAPIIHHHSNDQKNNEHCDGTNVSNLYYKATNTRITSKNRLRYIADGVMYDIIANLCMEYAQEQMMSIGHLEWRNVDVSVENDKGMEPIRVLIDKDWNHDSSNDRDARQTLLVVTGKGKVRAGIFSRSHLLTTGLEPSTAIPLIREAKRRNMRIVIFDPNARGDRMGMDTFTKSMDFVFIQGCNINSNIPNTGSIPLESNISHKCETNIQECVSDLNPTASSKSEEAARVTMIEEDQRQRPPNHLCILAHSMAGSQLVRYLDDKHIQPISSPPQPPLASTTTNHLSSWNIHHSIPLSSTPPDTKAIQPFIIQSIAFTDSTHNIQWIKKRNPILSSLLQHHPTSLYLKSDFKNESISSSSPPCYNNNRSSSLRRTSSSNEEHDMTLAKQHEQVTGKLVDTNTDEHWKRRFGTIVTKWAGTNVHELSNWTGKSCIWNHFDQVAIEGGAM